ncbi:MAG TPA: Gfo/Idh/MocA family oxidoreductase [Candidatus Hydrogenedentes bacterium]|nr:Gfo/Idh/MocA family oxidoreductase [Candidatus Hydrogenedentota bacterium]
MSDQIRWGILGTGNIARQFAEGLKSAEGAILSSVGSRTPETADAFADKYGIPRRHASYEALAQDPEVDAIYIATPHPMHKDNSILCLESGKATLCEKPFTINQKEAIEVVECARKNNLFLMEAMWTRFLPTLVETRKWLAGGVIGEPLMVRSDFGFRAGYNEESRLFDPKMGGGGLLDVGVYALSMAAMVLGTKPEQITSVATLGKSGVDEQNAVLLRYSDGAIAITASAIRTETPQDTLIIGSEGTIYLHAPFWRGTQVTLSVNGKEPETMEFALRGNGYNYEAEAVMECMRAGKTECDVMPLDDTIAIMGIMDEARAQWGLKYPME